MERTLRLLAFNFVLTAATVTACLVVGWVVGAVSGSIVYPDEKLVRGQHVPGLRIGGDPLDQRLGAQPRALLQVGPRLPFAPVVPDMTRHEQHTGA